MQPEKQIETQVFAKATAELDIEIQKELNIPTPSSPEEQIFANLKEVV